MGSKSQQQGEGAGRWARAFSFYPEFAMSLKGTCPRCKAHLDVAVAVVLADTDVTGRVFACRGTSPTSVISAQPKVEDRTAEGKACARSASADASTAVSADPEDASEV